MDHPNAMLVILIDTWKFESEEKEKSLAIDDFLEQHDSEDTADTPGGGGDGDDEIEHQLQMIFLKGKFTNNPVIVLEGLRYLR